MTVRLCKYRTVFITITVFVVSIFVILNIMVVQLNTFNTKSNAGISFEMKQKRNYQLPIYDEMQEAYSDTTEIHKGYLAQNRRKPKTMNVENNHEETVINVNIEQSLAGNTHISGISKFDKPNPKVYDHTYYEDEEQYEEDSEDENDNKGIDQLKNRQISNNRNLNGKESEIDNIEAIEKLDDDDSYDGYEDENDADDYDYDKTDPDMVENPVFKPGDFGDIHGVEFFKKPPLKFEDPNADVGKGSLRVNSETEPELVEQGIYWSSYVESLIPKGLPYGNVTKLIRLLRQSPVQTLAPPTWERCGRPLNAHVTLHGGIQMCARYRHPHTSYVYGEVLSFYLSRLLGMDNVPTVVLARTDGTSRQWGSINITKFGWKNNITVALIQWIDHLNNGISSRSRMPEIILQAYKSGQPITARTINKLHPHNLSTTHLSEIFQWGSMIVFDYITGNYDRVASMQDAAEIERRPEIIEESIRNLRKSSITNKLWLIDNESGLFDAYELMGMQNKFVKFHRRTLQTMCVFQSSLVNAINKLHETPSPHTRLVNFATSLEPLLQFLPNDKHYEAFVSLFHMRLKDVYEWIQHCDSLNK